MTDASLAKWRRANTTCFFEEFRLGADPGDRPRDPSSAAGEGTDTVAVLRPTVSRSPSRQLR